MNLVMVLSFMLALRAIGNLYVLENLKPILSIFYMLGVSGFVRYGALNAPILISKRHLPRLRSIFAFGKIGFGKSIKVIEEVDPGAVHGTNLRVLKYPHPKLRAENEPVSVFDDSIRKIAMEMLLVMYESDGVGLAAPQVGINKRIMVFNEKGEADAKDTEIILINPHIVASSSERKSSEEGCLSFPLIYGDVERAAWIEVEYQTLDGTKVTKRFEDRPAVIFQHEYDHLDKVTTEFDILLCTP